MIFIIWNEVKSCLSVNPVSYPLPCILTEKVAIKILDKTKLDQKTQRLLSREISSMERLHHPNVIRLYEVVETLAKLHIIMEYAGGGELFTKISSEGKLPESEAKMVFAQVVAAVSHMVSGFTFSFRVSVELVDTGRIWWDG